MVGIKTQAQFSLKIQPVDPMELVEMASLCARFGGQSVHALDSTIGMSRFKTSFSSPVKGLEHKFQVYYNQNLCVINFRGSQPNVESWMANAYASMIPAKGELEIDGQKWQYDFSDHPKAAVHSGYVLAIAFLYDDLKNQIQDAVQKGCRQLRIIGHSQGGGIASLFHAFVVQHQEALGLQKVGVKSYTFGAPMIGNAAFYEWHHKNLAKRHLSFHTANEEDPVPDLPLEYNDQNYIEKHLKEALVNGGSIQWTRLTKDVLSNYFKEDIKKIVHDIGYSIQDQVSQYNVPVTLPEPVEDVNYKKLGYRVEVAPYPVPVSLLREKSGSWTDQWMPEGPLFFQHYSGTYYKACFQKYFPVLFEVFEES